MLSDDVLLACHEGPGWMAIDSRKSEVLRENFGRMINYDQLTSFSLSPSGEKMEFGFHQLRTNIDGSIFACGIDGGEFDAEPFLSQGFFCFDIDRRRYVSPREGLLQLPVQSELPIKNWHFGHLNRSNPMLGNKALKLDELEESRKLAISKNASCFCLATNIGLRCYRADGEFIWMNSVPGGVLGTNFSQDGQFVMAAIPDGTIRWYRAVDGVEAMAFLPGGVDKWILWTPGGYYDCSPGFDHRLVWDVTHSQVERRDVFKASILRKYFFRPNIGAASLNHNPVDSESNLAFNQENAGLEGKQGMELFEAVAPPILELEGVGGVLGEVEISSKTAKIPIKFKIKKSSSGEVRKVFARLNGRPLTGEFSIPSTDETGYGEVDIPPGISGTLSIFAETQFATSDAACVLIKTKSPKTKNEKRLLFLGFGVDDLAVNNAADTNGDWTTDRFEIKSLGVNAAADLGHTVIDTKKVSSLIKEHMGWSYHKFVPVEVFNKEATSDRIRIELKKMALEANFGDTCIVYFSGHGQVVDSQFVLGTHDVDLSPLSHGNLVASELATLLENIRAQTILIIDACHSGSIATVVEGQSAHKFTPLDQVAQTLSSIEHGVTVFCSSGAAQESLARKGSGGFLTQAICEMLSGDNVIDDWIRQSPFAEKQAVSLDMLGQWSLYRVPLLARELNQELEKRGYLKEDSEFVFIQNSIFERPENVTDLEIKKFKTKNENKKISIEE